MTGRDRRRRGGRGEYGTCRGPRESLVVVGGGLAGLATGCYARMNGYRTTVLEMHDVVGGSCTSWDRGDYTFDWCVSWLLGSGPGNEMHRIWQELGALRGKEVRSFEVFNTVLGRDGRRVRFYSDPDRLERHLVELSPADAGPVREFCRDLRRFRTAVPAYPFLTPMGLMGRLERWRTLAGFLPYVPVLRRTMRTSMLDFSARLSDPLLREAFNVILYERHPGFPLLPFHFQLAAHANRSAGVPEGGSRGLAESIAERFRELGGTLRTEARVTRILVEGGRAVGVALSDGSEVRADVVVTACDGRTALVDLLGEEHLVEPHRTLFTRSVDEPGMVYPGYASVFLGLDRSFPDADPCTTVLLDPEETAGMHGIRDPNINVQFRSRHYPELSPEGRDVVYVTFFSDTAAWRELSEAPPRLTRPRGGRDRHTLPVRHGRAYVAAKRATAAAVVAALERRFPGIGSAVRVRDVATPLTQVRYTGNHDGSIAAWLPFAEAGEAVEELVKRHGPGVPGVEGLYLSGTWMTVGGLIRAAAAGRHVMQFVCRDDGRPFTAWVDDAPAPVQVVLPPPGVPVTTSEGRP